MLSLGKKKSKGSTIVSGWRRGPSRWSLGKRPSL
jgi:hypothetical protein